MNNPAISVVMPVYNREQYLKESIESILNQTFTDFEFIIVDDQSTDSSWQIIQEYAARDARIVAIKNNGKKGCYPARNCGHKLAKGKYLAVMDSDDIALPERLQIQFDFMEQNPDIDICGSWLKSFGAEEQVIQVPATHEEIHDIMFFSCAIPHQTVIYRIPDQIFYYSEEYASAQDYELFCRKINDWKFANIPEVLLLYRVHEKQISTAAKKEQSANGNRTRLTNLQNIGISLMPETQKIYFDLLFNQFIPNNIDEIAKLVAVFEKISAAGKHFGYGIKFQELIRFFQKKALDTGIINNITSLKLYFTFFIKSKAFDNSRAHLRYIYHCLRNLLHV